MNKIKIISSKLFARPSFLGGVSSVVDLGATLQVYNTSDSEVMADIYALQNDWESVGNDLKSSILKYEEEQSVTK